MELQGKRTMRKGKLIAISLILFFVLFFAAVVIYLLIVTTDSGEPGGHTRKMAILQVAGLNPADNDNDKLYHDRIVSRTVNLDSGQWAGEEQQKTCTMLPDVEKPEDVKKHCDSVEIYLVRDEQGQFQQVVLPINGKGAKSMMRAFIALEADGRTVKQILYYNQHETPMLGAKVEDEQWREQWVGKKVRDDKGHPALKVVIENADHNNEYTVEGITGATLTSTSVERSVNFWMGDRGYGHFLQRLHDDKNAILQ